MKKITFGFVIALALSAGALHAQNIGAGSMRFGGTVTFAPQGSSVADASGVSAWNGPGGSGLPLVTNATGSFAGLAGQPVMLTAPYSFNSGPVAPLWSVTSGWLTITFDLLSSTVVQQTSTFLVVTGIGIVRVPNYNPMLSRWALSIDSDGTFQAAMSIDSNSPFPVLPIPDDGATLLLLAIVIPFLAAVRRLKPARA